MRPIPRRRLNRLPLALYGMWDRKNERQKIIVASWMARGGIASVIQALMMAGSVGSGQCSAIVPMT